MTIVKLSTIPAGHRFRWANVLFEATHEETTFEGRPSRRVIYRSVSGRGAYQPGDRGLIPMDELVEACEGMTSEPAAPEPPRAHIIDLFEALKASLAPKPVVAAWRILDLDLDGTTTLSECPFADEASARQAYSEACAHAAEHGGNLKLMRGLECVARFSQIARNE